MKTNNLCNCCKKEIRRYFRKLDKASKIKPSHVHTGIRLDEIWSDFTVFMRFKNLHGQTGRKLLKGKEAYDIINNYVIKTLDKENEK